MEDIWGSEPHAEGKEDTQQLQILPPLRALLGLQPASLSE